MRSRSGVKGRSTVAIMEAIKGKKASKVKLPMGMSEGLGKHLQRMEALTPAQLRKKAKALGYKDMEPMPTTYQPMSGIPRQEVIQPPIVAPAVPLISASLAPMGAVAPMGAIVKALAVEVAKEKKKRAPRAPKAPTAPVARSETFEQFVAEWSRTKKHGKAMLESYLRKLYDSGAVYNEATKRWGKKSK